MSGCLDVTNSAARVKIGGNAWRVFQVGDKACRSGCENVAKGIQKSIGGEIKVIDAGGLAMGGIRNIGGKKFINPAGQGSAWFEHHVVVKGGKVFDALTGPKGQAIKAYKARWQYSDALNWGF